MFNNVAGMVEQFTSGNGDSQKLEQAASDHVDQMDGDEVVGHLQAAAADMNQNGKPDLAHEVEDMIAQKQSNPTALKDAAISFIRANPQVLTHFAPPFAQGILNRMA